METRKKYRLQISSGQGPAECEMAVRLLADALCKEFDETIITQSVPGVRDGCFKSITIESAYDIHFLEGTVKWVCQSPFRPNHKRKNWFVDLSPMSDCDLADIDESLVRFDTFRSGGKGGQNVNKVETGVRATYIPLGISAVSTDERSQGQNKKTALERLKKMVTIENNSKKLDVDRSNWLEHRRIERGNAIREYAGMEFRRIR